MYVVWYYEKRFWIIIVSQQLTIHLNPGNIFWEENYGKVYNKHLRKTMICTSSFQDFKPVWIEFWTHDKYWITVAINTRQCGYWITIVCQHSTIWVLSILKISFGKKTIVKFQQNFKKTVIRTYSFQDSMPVSIEFWTHDHYWIIIVCQHSTIWVLSILKISFGKKVMV